MLAESIQDALDHPRLIPALILGVSLSALAIAYASQVWGGLQPCVLCIYQRYAYGAAVVFGLLGFALGENPAARRGLIFLGGLAFLGGAATAAFHFGVEQHWWQGTAECHAPGFDPSLSIEDLRKQLLDTSFVACDEISWSLFGISMAGYNLLVSLDLALACLWAASRMSGRRLA